MKKLKFIVEKNQDGYWAYRSEKDNVIGAYGQTLGELKADIVRAYNLLDVNNQIDESNIGLQFDITSFFELYSGVIAAAGIGKRAGMQKSLISEYVNGKKKPSKKQVEKLLTTINELGKELADVEMV